MEKITEGTMFVYESNEIKAVCPLKHTSVKAKITGFLSEVEVQQEFTNPFDKKIEAVYKFPLSENSAVFEMIMQTGNRTIRSEIKKKEEARRLYETAKTKGYTSALLEQDRPNIFTQRAANILPGETITITLRYFETLNYSDGWYDFAFPTVITPRYIPKTMQENIEEFFKINPTTVLPPEIRAGHDISIQVELDAGFEAKKIISPLHEITVKKESKKAIIELKNKETIPNKDFILKYKTTEENISDTLLTDYDGKTGHFLLIIQPPEKTAKKEIIPKEMIFVIDDSGSMSGWPIEKAKETMKHCIKHMNPEDTFQMYSFADELTQLFDKPKENNEKNTDLALRFLADRKGSGGTEMLPAVNAALAPPHTDKVRIVCFMTDGAVGNEAEILDTLKRNNDKARFFIFGIGNSPNRYLINEIAIAGRGQAQFVTTEEDGKTAAKKFHEMTANPILTDINLQFDANVESVYPAQTNDLHDSRPVIVTGKFKPGKTGKVIITGKQKDKKYKREISLNFKKQQNPAIGKLWARSKISNLNAQNYLMFKKEIIEEITQTALDYHLMSDYTSLIAIEKIAKEGELQTVDVPVNIPDSTSYEGIYGQREESTAGLSRGLASPFVMDGLKEEQERGITIPFKCRTGAPLYRFKTYRHGAPITTFSEIAVICKSLKLPQQAAVIAAQIFNRLKGRLMDEKPDTIMAAAIFFACKKTRINFNIDDLCKACNTTKEETYKVGRRIIREVGMP